MKHNLETRVANLDMEDYIFEVAVTIDEVTEIKSGQKKVRKQPRMPGYVLVRMDLTDESWGAVRHTPGVTGFVGNAHDPVPLIAGVANTWLFAVTGVMFTAALGALSAGYVNSANLGIPIATYVLGDPALAAPALMFQLGMYTPLYVAVLDWSTAREARVDDDAGRPRRVRGAQGGGLHQ